MFPELAARPIAPAINSPARSLRLIVTRLLSTSRPPCPGEPFMCPDADRTAVVYDPPAPDLPHMAVLFDAGGEVVAVRPVESIDAGEAALANLVENLTAEQQQTA